MESFWLLFKNEDPLLLTLHSVFLFESNALQLVMFYIQTHAQCFLVKLYINNKNEMFRQIEKGIPHIFAFYAWMAAVKCALSQQAMCKCSVARWEGEKGCNLRNSVAFVTARAHQLWGPLGDQAPLLTSFGILQQ